MRRLAGGDTSGAVPATESRDEIGEMARAVQYFQTQAVAANLLTDRVGEDVVRIDYGLEIPTSMAPGRVAMPGRRAR
jgi:hypothetical protein